ncbi:hypothetical protein M0802_000701 [Mischocyttarus mexicanus]|nr:hypothetical protein M0802_000701 [Mischocyttarus mexicanus]
MPNNMAPPSDVKQVPRNSYRDFGKVTRDSCSPEKNFDKNCDKNSEKASTLKKICQKMYTFLISFYHS